MQALDCIEKGVGGLLIEEGKKKGLLSEVLGDFYATPLKNFDKQKRLLTARLVVTIAIKAIESLREGKLDKLDPLVSECQCHLRALKIADLANRLLTSESFRKELDVTQAALMKQQATIQKLAQSIKRVISSKESSEESIKTMLGEEVLVSEDVITLTQCYMLALAKSIKKKSKECSHCGELIPSVAEVTEVSKLSKLQRGGLDSQNKPIVYMAKEKLAITSCQELQKMMKPPLGEEAAASLEKLKRLAGKQSKRVELPSYYSLRAVIKVALSRDIPLLLKVKRAAHHLEILDEPFELAVLYVGEDKKEYKAAPITPHYLKKAGIILEAQRVCKDPKEGVDEYISRLKSIPIEEIIEMNGAAHRMYTDGDEPLMDLIDAEEKKRLTDLKEKAIKVGCAKQNQQLLCINHIFADIVSNQIKGLYIKE